MTPERWRVTVITEEALEPSDQELDDVRAELRMQPDVDAVCDVERAPNGAVRAVMSVSDKSSVNAKSKATGALVGALQESTVWVRTRYVGKGPIEQAKVASAEAKPLGPNDPDC